MDNYILAQSWARANVQDRLWYIMNESDKDILKQKESMVFGDKCYVIKSKNFYILGNDGIWYEM